LQNAYFVFVRALLVLIFFCLKHTAQANIIEGTELMATQISHCSVR